MNTRLVEETITKRDSRSETVLFLEIFDSVRGVIERKVINYSGLPVDDKHISSSYRESERKRKGKK